MKNWNASICTAFLAVLCTQAAVRNEWTFEADASGTGLSGAENSGSEGALFGAGGAGVLETDGQGALLSTPSGSSLWDPGSELDADIGNAASGVRYLRYDLDYDVSSNSLFGSTIGISFVDPSGTNLSGLVLAHDAAGSDEVPAGKVMEPVTDFLPLQGTISAIAKVDLDASEMTVWYDVTGSNTFAESSPALIEPLSISSIDELRVLATGDSSPGGSGDLVSVENIRTADSWAEITSPLADYSLPPEISIVSFTDQLGGAMQLGQSNLLTVVMQSTFSPATDLSSSLTHTGAGGDFTIVPSNAPDSVGPNRFVTNTYWVTSHTDGAFEFAAQALLGGQPVGDDVRLEILVGERIGLESFVVTNDVGGIFPNVIEPGESFDLILTHINNGGLTLLDVTNSVVADQSQVFPSITTSPGADIYPVLTVGQTVSTTYRVSCAADTPDGLQTFYVVNRNATKEWTVPISVNVFSQPVISTSANELILYVAPGKVESSQITVTNTGNAAAEFTVTDNGQRPTRYQVESQLVDRVWFGPAGLTSETRFSSWDGTNAVSMEFGFNFNLFGTPYHILAVSQHGAVTLTSTNLVISTNDTTVTTNTLTAQLMPFEKSMPFDQSSIGYIQEADRLVLTWGNGTGQEVQAWLHTDGTVRYLYERGAWGDGEIGLRDAYSSQMFDHIPGSTGRDCLALTPVPWVTCSPVSGTLDGFESVLSLTVTADASEITEAGLTHSFQTLINWNDGSQAVDVTVVVEEEDRFLTVIYPISISGPAGTISPADTMVLTNTGNKTQSYIITDYNEDDMGYAPAQAGYQWIHIPEAAPYILSEADLGSRVLPIGFPFEFFGNTFTGLTVEVDGTITLAEHQRIVPFANELSLNGNSSVRVYSDIAQNRFVVTWEDLSQSDGEDNQVFQAVLYRSGEVNFNYWRVGGNWPDAEIELYGGYPVSSTLSNGATVTVEHIPIVETVYVTNWIGNIMKIDEEQVVTGTNVVTTFDDPAVHQSIRFAPDKRYISYSPISGTIPPGAAVEVLLRGDATTLSAGDSITELLSFYAGSYDPYVESLVDGSDEYRWDVSQGNSFEYYLVKTDGSAPDFIKPAILHVGSYIGTEVSSSSIGSLDLREWAWGRNEADSIGFDTIYVKISTSSKAKDRDPDQRNKEYIQKGPLYVPITFNVANGVSAAEIAADPVLSASMWGTDEVPSVSHQVNPDGSRTLTWPVPADRFDRTYTVWYTISLDAGWEPITTVFNDTVFVDTDPVRTSQPAAFYKVTVQ